MQTKTTSFKPKDRLIFYWGKYSKYHQLARKDGKPYFDGITPGTVKRIIPRTGKILVTWDDGRTTYTTEEYLKRFTAPLFNPPKLIKKEKP